MTSQKGPSKGKVTNLFDGDQVASEEEEIQDGATVLPVPLPKAPKTKASKLRRSTFQLRNSTVDELDRFHLELQLALGKQNAPYKEVLVEAAIVHFLDSARANPGEWLDVLIAWQQARRSR